MKTSLFSLPCTVAIHPFFSLDRKGLEAKLQTEFGDNAATVLDTYVKANPAASPAELYIAIRSILFRGLGSITIAEQKVKQGGAPAYLYNFGYKSELKVPGTDYAFGSMHAMDIPFKFYNISSGMAGNRQERFEAADNMCQLWTSFARNGKPAAKGQPQWKPYNLESRPTLRIDTTCSLLHHRYQKEIDMWRDMADESI